MLIRTDPCFFLLPKKTPNRWTFFGEAPRFGTGYGGRDFSMVTCDAWVYDLLGGGFKYFLFSPLPGEMIKFD